MKTPVLQPLGTTQRIFELADLRKSVWWVSQRKQIPAAFVQNWNARQLDRWVKGQYLMEIIGWK